MKDKSALKEKIYLLEAKMLEPDVRQSAEKIDGLLSDDFMEFCSSGYIYKYEKGDTFGTKSDKDELDWEIKNFSINILSDNVILANYKVIKHNQLKNNESLRSSIWKHIEGNWKMIFHQGTPVTE